MNQSAPEFFYPNQMGRIILLATEEILGPAGVSSLLDLASLPEYFDQLPPNNHDLNFPFGAVSGLMAALDSKYGPRGGRGLAMRIGRSCFQTGLHEFGPLFGLTDLAFRLLPMQTKLKVGAEAFADIFNKHSDQRVRIEHNAKQILWHIERCPVCWDQHSETPTCHLAVGVLQEALYWMSGGKFFNVEETACIACGDNVCTIVIEKTPLS